MIYAMSDIHGCLDAFEDALRGIDLTDPASRLVLLGDYCDRGPDSLGVMKKVMELQGKYPDQVVALRGNHEEMLLEYIDMASEDLGFTRAWMLADSNLATARSFLDADAFEEVKHLLRIRQFEDAYLLTVRCIKENHSDVLRWVRRLPYYYESGCGQVFVHAGIDEDAGELWRIGTPDEYFTAMPPDYLGKRFPLDVVAGHVNTETVSGIPGYRGIFFDGASHYYIDGNVIEHGSIPILAYNEHSGRYSGPGLGD